MSNMSYVFDFIDWPEINVKVCTERPKTFDISIVLIYVIKFNNNDNMTQISLMQVLITFVGRY